MKKKKEDEMNLPADLRNTLDNLGVFDVDTELRSHGLDPAIKHAVVKRNLFVQNFGGSPQETFPNIAEWFIEEHGMLSWGYVTSSCNTYAPALPGHPGILFNCSLKVGAQARIVTRIDRDSGIWQYQGTYEVISQSTMSIASWNNLHEKVSCSISAPLFQVFILDAFEGPTFVGWTHYET